MIDTGVVVILYATGVLISFLIGIKLGIWACGKDDSVELKRSKEDVNKTLRMVLEHHKSLITTQPDMVDKYPNYDPLERTLEMYDDFYEWLIDEIDFEESWRDKR